MHARLAVVIVATACTGAAGPQGSQGSMGTAGSPGADGMTGPAGPGQVWKDASGVTIAGSFFFVDRFAQGTASLRMGYVDGNGDFWFVSRITGNAGTFGGSLTTIASEYASTNCTGAAYYNVPLLPAPHITFLDLGNQPRTLAEGTMGATFQYGSISDAGVCTTAAGTDTNAIPLTEITALPVLTTPSLASRPLPFHPAIGA